MNLELNKIAAAVLLAGLIAMLAGTVANILYHADESDGGKGYKVAGVDQAPDSAKKEEKEEEIDLATLLASASAADGKKVAKKCAACHSFDKGGANRVGPNLWAVLGGKKAHIKDFNYSSAMLEKGGEWNYEAIYNFLKSPRKFISGTKMAFAGLRKPEDIAAIIAYLRKQHDNPPPLP